MKNKITLALCALLMTAIISSCATSNDVASNRKIQKRKYNKGLFVSKNKKSFGKSNEESNEESNEVVKVQNEVVEVENEAFVSNFKAEVGARVQLETVANSSEVKKVSGSDLSNNSMVDNSLEIMTLKNVEVKELKVKKKRRNKKQNVNNQSSSDDMMILLIILCFLLPFVAVGIKTSWDIKKMLICLILSILFWFPGVIYALLVVLDVI